jgi:hypothetical protein
MYWITALASRRADVKNLAGGLPDATIPEIAPNGIPLRTLSMLLRSDTPEMKGGIQSNPPAT